MDLEWLEKRFIRRLDVAEHHLLQSLAHSSLPPVRRGELHELDGWLSEIWQLWCRFCRRVVIDSSLGCVSRSGVVYPAAHASEGVVSFIAAKQKRGVAPTNVGTNSELRLEPTWGHLDKLIEVIEAVNPPNRGVLLGAFGTVPEIEHVRLVRNASAHRNSQTMANVLGFQANYRAFAVRHPIQALFWTDTGSGRALIQARLEDMRVAARNACA